jgi:uncharacterized membrane protein YphA (DoxX/SURF4 family)
MTARHSVYWTATTLTALSFVSGGAAYLLGLDAPRRGVVELGYPAYVLTLLGILKVLGGLAILAPGLPRLKEWAYAGISFDLIGAAFSQAASGHPPDKVIAPLVMLAIALLSWALRPRSRALESGKSISAPANTGARELANAPI